MEDMMPLDTLKSEATLLWDTLEMAPDSLQTAQQSAIEYFHSGRLQEAEILCRKILGLHPDHADTLHLLGLIAYRAGNFRLACDTLRQAISHHGKEATYHVNLGNALRAMAQLDGAEESYKLALQINPSLAEADFHLATVHKLQGRLDEAISGYRSALEKKANYPKAYYSLGSTLLLLGRADEAFISFQSALKYKPDFAQAHYGIANAHRVSGKLTEAIESYHEAIRLDPNLAEAHNNLGNVLKDLGQWAKAMASYKQAIRLRPDLAEAHNNIGIIQGDRGELDAAVEEFQRAIQLRPGFAEAYNNLANVLKDQGNLDDAIFYYRKAIGIDPRFHKAHSNLLFTLNYHLDYDLSSIFEEHRRWGALYGSQGEIPRSYPNDPAPERRLRIGYLSPDLKDHPVARFLEPILSHHDPCRVEVFCYAEVAVPDSTTTRFKSLSHHWRETWGRSDNELANTIREDAIDILVDLAGHSLDNRLLVLASKPAPIQITYLGYCNTTGMTTVDYLLTDETVDPVGLEKYYVEELVRLKHGFTCFAPPSNAPSVSSLPGRERGQITFGSFNNLAKINVKVIDLWAEVLKAVPSSRLVIFRDTLKGTLVGYFLEQFAKRGIGKERIDLGGEVSRDTGHLSLYEKVDIALDPFPWAGHATTCEALWMGVPVITLAADRHAGRMSASSLTQAGLSHLVATSYEAFIRIARELAGDVDSLETLRMDLRRKIQASPLCDGKTFTRELEEAFFMMWKRWCSKS